MNTVSDISAFLNEKVPYSMKMDFDNFGLLAGFPEKEVRTVLVALDITLDVIREAKELGAELIISHHPIIFSPMRRVCTDSAEGKRLICLLQAGISAICLHTNLDRIEGGVNTALSEAVGAHPTEYLDIGCTAVLPEAMPIAGFLDICRTALNAADIRFYDSDKPVFRLAVCGGAGGDLVTQALSLGCDTLLTGEIHHHQWLEGMEKGINMIEAGHFATENVAVPVLAGLISERYPELRVVCSARSHCVHTGFSI